MHDRYHQAWFNYDAPACETCVQLTRPSSARENSDGTSMQSQPMIYLTEEYTRKAPWLTDSR